MLALLSPVPALLPSPPSLRANHITPLLPSPPSLRANHKFTPRARPPIAKLTDTSTLQERRKRLWAELLDVERAIKEEADEEKNKGVALGSATSVLDMSFGYLSMSAGVYT